MKTVFVNEIRHLKPGLRRKMLQGDVSYRDQEKQVESEKEHEYALKDAARRTGFGGERHLPEEHRVNVLARDNLGRMPHIAVKRDDSADT